MEGWADIDGICRIVSENKKSPKGGGLEFCSENGKEVKCTGELTILKSQAMVVDVLPSLPPPVVLEQPSATPHETSLAAAPRSLGCPDAANAWSRFPFFAAFCKPLLAFMAIILGSTTHVSPMHFSSRVAVKPTRASAEAVCKLRGRERRPLRPGAAVQSNEVASTDVAVWS